MTSEPGEPGCQDRDLRDLVERLSEEVRQHTAQLAELRPRPDQKRRPFSGAARVGLAGLLVFLLGTVPTVLAHTGYFSDVPHGAQFHTEINEIAGAGITTGCTATPTYCPDGVVDRKAMAAFMSRGFGRAYHSSFSLFVPAGGSTPQNFLFKTGLPLNLLPGAKGLVKADVSLSVLNSGITGANSCGYFFVMTAQPGLLSEVSMTEYSYFVTLTQQNIRTNVTLSGLAAVSVQYPVIQVKVFETNDTACGSQGSVVGDILLTYFPLSGAPPPP